MKLCNKCETRKPLSQFGKKKTSNDGLQLWCSECTKSYYNQWRKSNKELSTPNEARSFKKFYGSIHGRAVHMHNNMRARAKRNGVECSITLSWIESKLTVGKCEATHLPFVFKEGTGKGHRENSFSPSIERIDPTGSYSEENCQMTCWIYNRAKGAFPLADLITMVSALANQRTVN